jgi:hypothetical protein
LNCDEFRLSNTNYRCHDEHRLSKTEYTETMCKEHVIPRPSRCWKRLRHQTSRQTSRPTWKVQKTKQSL